LLNSHRYGTQNVLITLIDYNLKKSACQAICEIFYIGGIFLDKLPNMKVKKAHIFQNFSTERKNFRTVNSFITH